MFSISSWTGSAPVAWPPSHCPPSSGASATRPIRTSPSSSGLEVGFAGVLIGALMLRFGVLPLLFWHFTVDAIYTALILLRSGNAYYVASGAIASGILLLPLLISAALAARRGGFVSAQGLNKRGRRHGPGAARGARRARGRSGRAAGSGTDPPPCGNCRGGASSAFARPAPPLARISEDRIGRARALQVAAEFLRANGASPDAFRSVAYVGTGFTDDETAREVGPEDHGKIPGFSDAAARYVLQKGGPEDFRRLSEVNLPLAFWAVRFVQAEKKEEWKVVVDAKRGRVAVFANPRDEGRPRERRPPGSGPGRARSKQPRGWGTRRPITACSRSGRRRGPGAWTRPWCSRRRLRASGRPGLA